MCIVTGIEDVARLLTNREDIVAQLLDGPATVRDLDTALDRSRRSIAQVLDSFAEYRIVRKCSGLYQLTVPGEYLAEAYADYTHVVDSVENHAELLARVPVDAELDARMIDGADITGDTVADPDTLFDPIEASMDDANRIRGMSPVLRRRYVDVFSDHIFGQETAVELLFDQNTVASIGNFYPEEWRVALGRENFTAWQSDEIPPFGVIIVDDALVWVGMYREPGQGDMVGTLYNTSDTAIKWASDLFERYQDRAREIELDDSDSTESFYR
jgi:predicted transcriptional regulator